MSASSKCTSTSLDTTYYTSKDSLTQLTCTTNKSAASLIRPRSGLCKILRMKWWRRWSHCSTTNLHSMNNFLTSWSVAYSVKRFLTQLVTCSVRTILSHSLWMMMIRSVQMQTTSPWTMMSSVLVIVNHWLKVSLRSQLVMKSKSSGLPQRENFQIIYLMSFVSNRCRS